MARPDLGAVPIEEQATCSTHAALTRIPGGLPRLLRCFAAKAGAACYVSCDLTLKRYELSPVQPLRKVRRKRVLLFASQLF